MQYDLDLPSANDARVLVCYYAVRDAVRGACGPRLSTARTGSIDRFDFKCFNLGVFHVCSIVLAVVSELSVSSCL